MSTTVAKHVADNLHFPFLSGQTIRLQRLKWLARNPLLLRLESPSSCFLRLGGQRRRVRRPSSCVWPVFIYYHGKCSYFTLIRVECSCVRWQRRGHSKDTLVNAFILQKQTVWLIGFGQTFPSEDIHAIALDERANVNALRGDC